MKKNRRGSIGCYVYRHIRHDRNEVFYIGIGSGYDYQRAYQKCKRSKFWNNVVAGTDYSVEILVDHLSREQAEEKEKEFISLYKLRRDGGTLVNLTYGGDGSYGLKGELSPNYGKKYTKERVDKMRQIARSAVTDETRAKLSASAKARTYSYETRRKISEAGKGRKWSLEQRTQSSIRQKGKKGKPHSEESKRKISESLKGKPRPVSEAHKESMKKGWAKRRERLLQQANVSLQQEATASA